MRLIDADALYTLFVKMKSFGELTAKKAIRCVEEAPTVEAIPVEWIRKYTEENRLYQSDDFDLYINDMIADWAERETE